MSETPVTEGMYVFAVQIPKGADKMWNALTCAYGATATHNQDELSINFFPSQYDAEKFTEMIKQRMQVPKIQSLVKNTRQQYDEMVEQLKRFANEATSER